MYILMHPLTREIHCATLQHIWHSVFLFPFTYSGRHKPGKPRSDFALRMCFRRSPCHGLEKPHCRGQSECRDFNRSVASVPCWHAARGCHVCCHAWTQLEPLYHTATVDKIEWLKQTQLIGRILSLFRFQAVYLLEGLWPYKCISH